MFRFSENEFERAKGSESFRRESTTVQRKDSITSVSSYLRTPHKQFIRSGPSFEVERSALGGSNLEVTGLLGVLIRFGKTDDSAGLASSCNEATPHGSLSREYRTPVSPSLEVNQQLLPPGNSPFPWLELRSAQTANMSGF